MDNQNPAPQAQTDQPMMITLVDLDMLRQIIELATNRGAFKAPELADVGAVYNKLASFLDMAVAQAKAEQEAANPDATQAPAADAAPQGE